MNRELLNAIEGIIKERDETMLLTFEHVRRVQILTYEFLEKLLSSVIFHDKSKFNRQEFDDLVAQEVSGKKEYAKDDPHYSFNPHHPEHYENGIDDMNLLTIVEMLSGWKVDAEEQNRPFSEILKEYNQKYKVNDQLRKILENTAKQLNWL